MEVEGTIIKTTGFGAFAEFGDGLEGLIHITQLGSKHVSQPDKAFEIGHKIKAKIVKVDTSNKKIALSIKAYEENLDIEAIEKEQNQLEAFKEEDNEQKNWLNLILNF